MTAFFKNIMVYNINLFMDPKKKLLKWKKRESTKGKALR